MTDEAEQRDLREVLTEFWLSAMESEAAPFGDRVKVSELLAKYILSDGASRVPRRGVPKRPSTAEVLKLVGQFEEAE